MRHSTNDTLVNNTAYFPFMEWTSTPEKFREYTESAEYRRSVITRIVLHRLLHRAISSTSLYATTSPMTSDMVNAAIHLLNHTPTDINACREALNSGETITGETIRQLFSGSGVICPGNPGGDVVCGTVGLSTYMSIPASKPLRGGIEPKYYKRLIPKSTPGKFRVINAPDSTTKRIQREINAMFSKPIHEDLIAYTPGVNYVNKLKKLGKYESMFSFDIKDYYTQINTYKVNTNFDRFWLGPEIVKLVNTSEKIVTEIKAIINSSVSTGTLYLPEEFTDHVHTLIRFRRDVLTKEIKKLYDSMSVSNSIDVISKLMAGFLLTLLNSGYVKRDIQLKVMTSYGSGDEGYSRIEGKTVQFYFRDCITCSAGSVLCFENGDLSNLVSLNNMLIHIPSIFELRLNKTYHEMDSITMPNDTRNATPGIIGLCPTLPSKRPERVDQVLDTIYLNSLLKNYLFKAIFTNTFKDIKKVLDIQLDVAKHFETEAETDLTKFKTLKDAAIWHQVRNIKFRINVSKLEYTLSKEQGIWTTCLPQGSPCSGVIANMYASTLLSALNSKEALSNYKKIMYSDNLFMFSNDSISIYSESSVISAVKDIFRENSMDLNLDKIQHYSSDKKLLGVIMDEEGYLRVSRRYLRELNQIIINLNRNESINYKGKVFTREDIPKLKGRINWIKQVISDGPYVRNTIPMEFVSD